MNLKKFKKEDIIGLGWYQTLHILNVDIAIGSIAGAMLASRILHIVPNFAFWVSLPISVFIIYNIDHLVDGMKLKRDAHTLRHYYHYYYSKTLIRIILVLSIFLILFSFFFLEKPILLFGIGMTFISGLYFILIHYFGNKKSLLVQKELSVASIYTFGIWGGPAALLGYEINLSQIILLAVFFLCAFIAVLMFSYYEQETDRIDNHTTLVTRFGGGLVKPILYCLFAMLFALCIFLILRSHIAVYINTAKLLILMGIFLLIIFSYPKIFKKKNRYRYLTELIFWLPALSFWL